MNKPYKVMKYIVIIKNFIKEISKEYMKNG